MSYVNNMNYVNNMSNVSHMSIFMIRLISLFLLWGIFLLIYNDGTLKLQKENIERKNFQNMQKTQFLKAKNSLELEKKFIELKARELKDREVKIKREIEELIFKPIIVSLNDMIKFKQREKKKINPIKNTCYDWLINYISEPIRKSVGSFKDKVIIIFKANTPKETVYGRENKLSKPKTQNKIRNHFMLKKKKKKLNTE